MSEPVIIGLSGQSCAGKNVAAALLEKHGFFCIDADETSRAVFLQEERAVFELFKGDAEKKGVTLCTNDSNSCFLEKKAFALLVFSDENLLKKHEAFILPKIEEKIKAQMTEAFTKNPSKPIILNAPTLHKTGLLKKCKFIFYIKAPIFLRIIRAKKRDKIPLKDILARFSKQKDFFSQYFFLNADIVVVNNSGSTAALEKKLLQELKKRGF